MNQFDISVAQYLSTMGYLIQLQVDIGSSRYGDEPDLGPDFLAFDFKEKVIYVVSVSYFYEVGHLLNQLMNRKVKYYERIHDHMKAFQDWEIKTWVFAREVRLEKVPSADDIVKTSLESIALPWNWNWEEREHFILRGEDADNTFNQKPSGTAV